jgi:hypothetical protein
MQKPSFLSFPTKVRGNQPSGDTHMLTQDPAVIDRAIKRFNQLKAINHLLTQEEHLEAVNNIRYSMGLNHFTHEEFVQQAIRNNQHNQYQQSLHSALGALGVQDQVIGAKESR